MKTCCEVAVVVLERKLSTCKAKVILTEYKNVHNLFYIYIYNVFFWMIILVTPEMSITDYHFNLTSWSLFLTEKDKKNKINHSCINHILHYVYLQTFDFLP